jgi:SAM-dependent methyltransferase/glycosyltransferase involved in cell wall biosynthesis
VQSSSVISSTIPDEKVLADRRLRVVALASYPDEAACTRFRIAQFIELLGKRGADVTLLPFLTTPAFRRLYDPRQWLRTMVALAAGTLRRFTQLAAVYRADVIFVQREAMLLGPPVLEWFAARVARRPIVLDLDDATYLNQSSVYGRLTRFLKAPRKTDRLIDWASVVICGNDWIADHVRSRGKAVAVVMPTVVNTESFVPVDKDASRVPVIGWVGSHSTTEYLQAIVPVLARLRREFEFRVRVVGAANPISIPGVEVESLPWQRDREIHDFQTLDIGLYPLPDDMWAKSKSGLKAIEYLAVGVPFVASPVGVVASAGLAGTTHFLASTDQEWYEALAVLLRDPEQRRRMGAAGRAYAVRHYSVDQVSDVLDRILRNAAGPQMPLASSGVARRNIDEVVVSGFGDEWSRFDQTTVSDSELRELFDAYFDTFPWESLPPDAVGMDVGCGSGRWARYVAPRVGKLLCVDASRMAADVARRNLAGQPNAEVLVASVDDLPVPDASLDFAYSVGVLHHVPDTAAGLKSCAEKLKPGAPFLVYLYYAFDNRPLWFRFVWRLSNPLRFLISRMPHGLRYLLSQTLAALVYWPLARLSRALERLGLNVEHMPLSYYRQRSFYVMRTDVLDRFGTRLEHRFTRAEIDSMLRDAGFEDIRFNNAPPYWCAVGTRRRDEAPRSAV